MGLVLTGEAAEKARQRAESLGLDPVDYLERLVEADADSDKLIGELLREAMDEPEEPWDMEAIRRDGRALAAKLRRT